MTHNKIKSFNPFPLDEEVGERAIPAITNQHGKVISPVGVNTLCRVRHFSTINVNTGSKRPYPRFRCCLLYTSDAADE